MSHKNHYILLAVFLLYGFLLTPLGNYKNPEQEHSGYYNIQKIDPGDDTGFYAYLRSGVIDGNFDFFNEKRYWHFDAITTTGYSANFWYIGAPIIWFPFFLIGHAVAWVYNSLGYPVTTDGYSFPYHAFTFLASAWEVLVALLLCYKVLEKFYSQTASLITTLLVFSSTCLPYFTFIRNRMSHSGDLLVGFIFFLLFLGFRERMANRSLPSLAFFTFWGIMAGLLADLRYISVVYCILPLGMALKLFLDPASTDTEKRRLRRGIGLAFLVFLITVSPQLAAWKKLHGVFSSLNPYTVAVQANIGSVMHSIGQLFFGGTRGLALTEPVWLFGLVGLAMVFIRDRLLGGLCWLLFLGFCVAPVVIGDPATLGQRYLIPAFPALAMGLGQLIDVLLKKRLHYVVIAVGGILSLWFYVLLLNYSYLLPFSDPEFALQALKNIPTIVKEKLFLPPATYPEFFLRKKVALADFLDYFFLVGFPIFFVVVSALLLPPVRRCMEISETMQTRVFRNFSTIFLVSMIFLTTFILIRHPELSPKIKKERLQIVAASKLAIDSPNLSSMNEFLRRSEEIAPPDERDYLIRADAGLLNGDFNSAKKYYLKALELNDHSTAYLQLERIDLMLGVLQKTIDIDAHLREYETRDDPTGELTRWKGIYALDQLLKPDEAVAYFNASLKINPEQKQAAGMKRAIAQHLEQIERLKARNISPGELPLELNLMLNTEFNEVRLHHSMIPQLY